jgi:hypothetical protein
MDYKLSNMINLFSHIFYNREVILERPWKVILHPAQKPE